MSLAILISPIIALSSQPLILLSWNHLPVWNHLSTWKHLYLNLSIIELSLIVRNLIGWRSIDHNSLWDWILSINLLVIDLWFWSYIWSLLLIEMETGWRCASWAWLFNNFMNDDSWVTSWRAANIGSIIDNRKIFWG